MSTSTLLSQTEVQTHVASFIDSFNSREIHNHVDKTYHPEASISQDDKIHRSAEKVKEVMTNIFKAFPDLKVKADHISQEENNVVVVYWRGEGTFENDYSGKTATHEKVALHGITSIRHQDEKIVDHRTTIHWGLI